MNAKIVGGVAILTIFLSSFLIIVPVHAANDCVFVTEGTTMTLQGDCTTDATILVPDGFTLDGAGHTITAVDPAEGYFAGAVVANAGSTAYVNNLVITTSSLKNWCAPSTPVDKRLRGVLFNGASGSITSNVVTNINKGFSGCQEGNGIEVRNAPFDGTHPNTQTVVVSGNTVTEYQKTGIVANGDLDVSVTNNYVGSSHSNKLYIAANSIQIGYGAKAAVNNNHIVGNQWDKVSIPQWTATAVLILYAGDVNVNHNTITGEGTDLGVYAYYSGTVNIMNNIIERTLPTGAIDPYGYGVFFYANSGKSKLVRNTLAGWNLPYWGADLDKVNQVEP